MNVWMAACGALAVAVGVQSCRLSDEQREHAETREAHTQMVAAQSEAARQAEADARAEEQRRTAEVQKAADEAEKARLTAEADAAAARDAGGRLRAQLATLAARCRAGAGNPDAAKPGAPADPTERMFADVQRRLDETAERIARHADAARAAGATCERAYDSLTAKPTPNQGGL